MPQGLSGKINLVLSLLLIIKSEFNAGELYW